MSLLRQSKDQGQKLAIIDKLNRSPAISDNQSKNYMIYLGSSTKLDEIAKLVIYLDEIRLTTLYLMRVEMKTSKKMLADLT